ncbi:MULTISPECIES: hypothetical protein [Mesorhizobium]|uniref:hypothetical protein n=1 Tax=Mesorhizobium TaxID=68287 RepID=UPI0012EC79F5|nr:MULTISPECIES: hypothetical protein [Mesorhizobium]WJI38440.1 hypothetical protein NL534_32420 [Mesorhizobium opportunistum]
MNTAEITIPLAGRAELAASIEAHGLIHNLLTGGVAVAAGRGPHRTGRGCDQGLSGQAPNDEARESEKDI